MNELVLFTGNALPTLIEAAGSQEFDAISLIKRRGV
jgi:hypothetical protein